MGVRPEYTNYHDYLKWRLDRRCKVIRDRADKAIRKFVNLQDTEQNFIEDDRLWLDKFAVGTGLDVCCGDFLVGTEDQASGVDGDDAAGLVGVDYFRQGDDLSFSGSGKLDFVVTNYLDGLPNPIKAFQEFHRVLKDGGKVALVCQDADSYPENDQYGALRNVRKQSTYTRVTIKHYLSRCDFKDITVEATDHRTLRVTGTK